MGTVERINDVVQRLSEEQAHKVLDFVQALEQEQISNEKSTSPEEIRQLALAAQAAFPKMD